MTVRPWLSRQFAAALALVSTLGVGACAASAGLFAEQAPSPEGDSEGPAHGRHQRHASSTVSSGPDRRTQPTEAPVARRAPHTGPDSPPTATDDTQNDAQPAPALSRQAPARPLQLPAHRSSPAYSAPRRSSYPSPSSVTSSSTPPPNPRTVDGHSRSGYGIPGGGFHYHPNPLPGSTHWSEVPLPGPEESPQKTPPETPEKTSAPPSPTGSSPATHEPSTSAPAAPTDTDESAAHPHD